MTRPTTHIGYLIERLEESLVDGLHSGCARTRGVDDVLQPLLARFSPHSFGVRPLQASGGSHC